MEGAGLANAIAQWGAGSFPIIFASKDKRRSKRFAAGLLLTRLRHSRKILSAKFSFQVLDATPSRNDMLRCNMVKYNA
jgi:hypothetical protein